MSAAFCAPCAFLVIGLWPGSRYWVTDVLANLSLPLAALTGLSAVVVAMLGWRLIGAAMCVASILALWVGVSGRASTGLDSTIPPGGGSLRVFHINARADNKELDALVRMLTASDHDLITMVDMPTELALKLRADGMGGLFEHRSFSAPNEHLSQWVFVLSKWPLESWNPDGIDDASGMHAVVLEHPSGRVGVIAVHASSPRNLQRWRAGNATIERVRENAERMRASGLPVIVLGDLNATPTGGRSSTLRRAGLRRAKPAWVMDGTYPASFAGVFRLSIDDAAVSEEWSVVDWSTLPCPGSDHEALELLLAR